MKKLRPKIVVTTLRIENKKTDYHLFWDSYIEALVEAGGIPVLLPPEERLLGQFFPDIDGLLLAGGTDIEPAYFGESVRPNSTHINPRRDAFETRLARRCLRLNLPILGICRGMQVLNVVSGGTLWSDLRSQYAESIDHNRRDLPNTAIHPIRILKESRLNRILGAEILEVNSTHHQAIKKLGKGLVAIAFAPDNVIEGIESTSYRFLIGVQWHPERLFKEHRVHLRLFQSLVKACEKR